MVQKLRKWVIGSLQIKAMLLIISAVLVLLAIFLLYDLQTQRETLEAALLQKGKSIALSGAAAVEQVLEDAIATGRLTEEELFDTDYQPIPNTDPQKYHTAYDTFTDANLREIHDAYLEDPDVLFAAAADVSGYVPTHNSIYAQPLTGDYETDLVGNRTKRIFDDPVGLAAVQNTEPFLRQIYYRDTGEVAWDISAPIWVNGRHWGAFRLALGLDQINARMAVLTRRIVTAALLLSAGVGLAAFFIARRIAKPVRGLAVAAQQVAQGDLDVEVKVRTEDEIGQLAETFNTMAAQIKNLIDTLEQRVAGRTQRLEAVATLSEYLSSILSLEELLTEVVHQVKDRFDYYHVHIYLFDEARERLVVAAGTGVAGEQMKTEGHSIALDAAASLVARAARSKEVVVVDNVREADDWLPNPLLPETYSEMAVPIMLKEEVLGVLDVQEEDVAGLDEADASLLRSLANQVAVAIRNAHLFEEVETALARAEATQQQYVEQSWDRIKVARRGVERVQFDLTRAAALNETVVTSARQRALAQKELTIVPLGSEKEDQGEEPTPSVLVAPITLQQVPIGTVQLHGTASDRDWTEAEMALIRAVVDQVAQVAENLRLLDESQERAARERLVGQISDKLRRAPDVETLMKSAVSELSRVLGPARTFVQFGSEEELTGAKTEADDRLADGLTPAGGTSNGGSVPDDTQLGRSTGNGQGETL